MLTCSSDVILACFHSFEKMSFDHQLIGKLQPLDTQPCLAAYKIEVSGVS